MGTTFYFITHIYSLDSEFLLWERCIPTVQKQVSVKIDLGYKQHGSGKSSLIKIVFKVDVPVRLHTGIFLHRLHNCLMETKETCSHVNIDVEFHLEDKPYLTVHECSGFKLQVGDLHNLQAIREFIPYRTHATCSPSERLHAIW